MLIDTHTHLYSEEFKADLPQVIERAKLVGVAKFLLPAIDSRHTNEMHKIKSQFPSEMFLMAGLHPCYVKPETINKELNHVYKNLHTHTYIGVGEIGIDRYWGREFISLQQEAFKKQIQWAKQHKLPIAIHCREAFDEVFEVLEEEKSEDLTGVVHCFSGDEKQAIKTLDLGFKLGIGGVVTFKNGKIDQFLHKIPLSSILLETDAPYLSPAPFRGKRNESSYLAYIVEKICAIYLKTPQQIADITTKNATELFQLIEECHRPIILV